MKPITINVSEPVYKAFQQHAKKADRKAAELIREAMELYRRERIQGQSSLRDRDPASVGGVIRPIDREDDLLGENVCSTHSLLRLFPGLEYAA